MQYTYYKGTETFLVYLAPDGLVWDADACVKTENASENDEIYINFEVDKTQLD